jgi:hypothetical protein
MKRSLLLAAALLVLVLVISVLPANPLKPIMLSELLFDKDGGWRLEIGQTLTSINLDGWYLKSKTDSALFKDGIKIGLFDYVVISNDSLKKPLTINPLGDSITIFSPLGRGEVFSFGPEYWKSISAPRYGQSICQDQEGYYLDNTPTMGAANDLSNAIGTIQFIVEDSLGHPITIADVAYYFSSNDPRTYNTNSSGIVSVSAPARRKWFFMNAPGFLQGQIWTQAYPESTITIPIILAHTPDAVENFGSPVPNSFALNNPYPNPFNPMVTVEYTLPRNGPVEIQVYNVAGKLVSEIFSGRQSEGKYVARWEAASYPSGVYLIRVRTSDGIAMKKCLLLK